MGYRRLNDPHAPASPKQLRYARNLGITDIPEGITMGEIGELIDEAKDNRMPTEDQLAFAKNLDIEVTETMTFDDVSDLLDVAVREHSIIAMRDNPALRAGKIVMYHGVPYKIWAIGNLNGKYRADLKPLKSGIPGYRAKNVMIVSLATATEVDPDTLPASLRS